jgi:hypothetical protein
LVAQIDGRKARQFHGTEFLVKTIQNEGKSGLLPLTEKAGTPPVKIEYAENISSQVRI